MKAAAWMMAGGVMVTTGCSLFSRDGALLCDASGTCAPPGTAVCAAGAIQLAPSAHPDSRNWRSLFNLDLGNAVCTPGVWFYNDKGDFSDWTQQDKDRFMGAMLDMGATTFWEEFPQQGEAMVPDCPAGGDLRRHERACRRPGGLGPGPA